MTYTCICSFFPNLPRYLDIFSSILVLPSDYESNKFCMRDGSRCSISDLCRGAQVNASSFILSLPETILSPSLCWHISYDKDLLISFAAPSLMKPNRKSMNLSSSVSRLSLCLLNRTIRSGTEPCSVISRIMFRPCLQHVSREDR